jgi:hypothetical protein
MFFDRFLSGFFPIGWKKWIEILLIAHIRQAMQELGHVAKWINSVSLA